MARFRFGLQSVLDLREREEKERRVAVAALERERLSLEERLRGYQGTIRSSKEGIRRAIAPGREGGVDRAAVRLEGRVSMAMEGRARQTALRLAGVHRRLETARGLLVEASRRRRALEVLRDRRLAAWESEARRRESAMLDEIGTIGASRRAEGAL